MTVLLILMSSLFKGKFYLRTCNYFAKALHGSTATCKRVSVPAKIRFTFTLFIKRFQLISINKQKFLSSFLSLFAIVI